MHFSIDKDDPREIALHDQVVEMFRRRYPAAYVSQLDKLADALIHNLREHRHQFWHWAQQGDPQFARLIADRAAKIEDENPDLLAKAPDADELAAFIDKARKDKLGAGYSDQRLLDIARHVSQMSAEERLEQARSLGMQLEYRAFGERPSNRDPDSVPQKAHTAGSKNAAFKDLSTDEQREVVAKKFGIEPGKLLASDFKRLRAEMLAFEERVSESTKPTAPKKVTPVGAVSTATAAAASGMSKEAFQSLSPEERIRHARRAAKGTP